LTISCVSGIVRRLETIVSTAVDMLDDLILDAFEVTPPRVSNNRGCVSA